MAVQASSLRGSIRTALTFLMRTHVVRPRAIVLLLIAIAAAGCCDKETLRLKPYYVNVFGDYAFRPVRFERSFVQGAVEQLSLSEAADTRGDPFSGGPIEGFLTADTDHFYLSLLNRGAAPITVLWPDARFTDERGRPHALYAGLHTEDPGRMLVPPPMTVQPHEKVRLVVAPVDKRYWTVSGCRERIPFSEPLVPNPFIGRTEQQIKDTLTRMSEAGTPVHLVLPIRSSESVARYTFTYRVHPRWEQHEQPGQEAVGGNTATTQ